jgi:hypothetical protein
MMHKTFSILLLVASIACLSLVSHVAIAQPAPKPVKPVKPVPVKPAPIVKPVPVKPAPKKPAPIVKPAPVKPAPKKPAPKPVKPTPKPVKKPSRRPSAAPTKSPTASPSEAPSEAPSSAPSEAPSSVPSEAPSSFPSARPTQAEPPIGKQCLGTSCGTLEENIDYLGMDIFNFTSDLQGCCDECTITEGCVAYSWNIDGTCSLKGNQTFPVASIGTYSAVLGSSFCTKIEKGVDYYGNDVGYMYFFNGHTVQDCCVACRLFSGCKYFAYTPYNGDCWLKSSDSGSQTNDYITSGSVIFPLLP